MDTKGAKTRERIDLGLGAILAGVDTSPNSEVSIDLPLPNGAPHNAATTWTLGDTATPAPQPLKSEFEALADERKWGEIVRLAETRLSNGEDLEAKLWWIRGHLGAFSMPVSFLSAPLDALCHTVTPESLDASVKTLLNETGLLVLQRLRDVNDVSHLRGLREALEGIGVREPKDRRERVGTSSFRSPKALPTVEESTPQRREVPVATVNSRPKRLTWSFVCFIIVVALMLLDRMFPHVRSPQMDIASESFVRSEIGLEQLTDVPGRRDPGGRLGALFYSIESEGTRNEAPPQKMDEAKQGATQPPPAIPTEPQREPVPARSKESVNTSGPLEGPEFRERIERVRPQSFEPRREVLQGGAPQAVLPGSSARGFEDQRTYKVLTRTSVLSAPSYGGRVIGQLDRGDRVLVEGKLGRWLRLRSKKGRGGYVLATDVEEAPELDIASDR
jgi:hypothetical protein